MDTILYIPDLVVIGGGLAGSEAAWQAAQRGLSVRLYEMRPEVTTGAHKTGLLAELVCSNSLGSKLPDRAAGVLKEELRRMGSMLLECAEASALPAGRALAVDRDLFARLVSEKIEAHPKIEVVREERTEIPTGLAIIASGPLTSEKLSDSIAALTGKSHLFFFDAIAPIVKLDSINFKTAFRGSRYEKSEDEAGDYINCPFTKEEYEAFVTALRSAERIPLRAFEGEIDAGVRAGSDQFFEGCLPVEVAAQRSENALAFGPLRPTGLFDPHINRRPYAVVQLRQDNLAGDLYNLVGFQTNLSFTDQQKIFRMIPGLEKAEFVRYGQMHRNTYMSSPAVLRPTLQFHNRDDLLFAGQIIGIEGYAGNIASGLIAGWNASRIFAGQPPLILPRTTLTGALCHYVTHAELKDFQPMKANFGILPPLESIKRMSRRARAQACTQRALADLESFLSQI